MSNQFISDATGDLDRKVRELENQIKSLTEVVARLHTDFIIHVNNSQDPVDLDDSLVK